MIDTRMESLSQGAQYRCHRYERQSSHKACGREQLSSTASTFVRLLALRRRLPRTKLERHVGSEHKGVVSNAVSTTASEWFPLCPPRGRRHYRGAPRTPAFLAREDRRPTVANHFCHDRSAACGLAGVRPQPVASPLTLVSMIDPWEAPTRP